MVSRLKALRVEVASVGGGMSTFFRTHVLSAFMLVLCVYIKNARSLAHHTFENPASRQRASGTPKEVGHKPNRQKRCSSICEKDT